MSSAHPSSSGSRRPRVALWLLLLMFFAPLLVAFALYYGLPGWRPVGSTHHGDLIDPARPLPELNYSVQEVGGATSTRNDVFTGKWNVLYVGDGRCDARCQQALTDIRQVRLALNDDVTRVQRVFVPTAACCNREVLEGAHKGLQIVQPAPSDLERLLASFPDYDGQPAATSGRIYIVDPLGNLMMSYAPDAPMKGLLEDLKKLLKLSHIG